VSRPLDGRLDDAVALELLERGDLLELGAAADAVRRRLHPSDDATFIVDRNINYTDYCVSGCRFCAFYKKPGSGEGYLLGEDDIFRKIDETLALGGTAIMMQGGLHPELDVCWFEQVFADVKERFPSLHLHCLSPPEVAHIAKQSGLSVQETLRRLRAAGLDSLPGGGAEILVDHVRSEVSPHKISADAWLDVMRLAHRQGMKTTATMMFGSLDTPADRVEHLRRIRELQDETGGFRAFFSWTFQDDGNRLAALVPPETRPTSFDYLLTQAVSRLYLDNMPHIGSSWVTQGKKIGQVALEFGADDLGSVMIEENVVSAAGTTHRATTDEFVHLIRALGKTPVQRDTLYREVRVFE